MMSMLSACRLVKELWLAGAATLAEGNALLPAFIADYNARFAKAPANNKDATVAGENCDRKKNCSAKIASRRGEDAHAHLRMGVTLEAVAPRVPNLGRGHTKPQMEPAQRTQTPGRLCSSHRRRCGGHVVGLVQSNGIPHSLHRLCQCASLVRLPSLRV